MKSVLTCCVVLLAFSIVGCSAPGKTRSEQRQHINSMRQQVLSELYQVAPDARGDIRKAPGYAVFSNVNVYLLFVSGGNGYGVVVDNATGNKTYMNMGEAGVGFGAGAKDYRLVFVFDTRAVMQRFIDTGWTFSGQADAAAKAQEKGAALGGQVVADGVRVYQLTETGLALQATVKGTKYWKDGDLN